MSELLELQAISHVFQARGIGLRRQSKTAVNNVSLRIDPQESVGLLGQSGSGKSTLARIILRLLKPTAGSVRFEGEDIWSLRGESLKSLRRSVQPVFQDPFDAFDPRTNVASFLAEPMKYLTDFDRARRLARIREVLSLVHLHEEVLTRLPHQLSGGQRQRLALARALTVRPRLLVLDEPTAALDVAIQAQIVNVLRDIQAETGVALLMVAHDLALSRQVVDRVVILREGEVVESGPVATVYDRPEDPYTQALLLASRAPWEVADEDWSDHKRPAVLELDPPG